MEKYLHRVMGIYSTAAVAESVGNRLARIGIPQEKMRVLGPGDAKLDAQFANDDVLKETLRVSTIGATVGTIVATAGNIAMTAAHISLFVAGPVLGALYVLGWGASLGGVAGAVVGAAVNKADLSELIKDALDGGHVVLLALTDTETQTTEARKIIAASMAEPDVVLSRDMRDALVSEH